MASLVAQMVKNLPPMQETRFDPWVRKIPLRRDWQAAPVFLPGEFHGQRSLVGYSSVGLKELDTTERIHFTFSNWGSEKPRLSWPQSSRRAGRCRTAQLAIIKQMSRQVSRGSAGDYQADEQAAVAGLSCQLSSRWAGRYRTAQLSIIKKMSRQVSPGSAGDYQKDEQAGVTRLNWAHSSRRAGRCHAAQLAIIKKMSRQVSRDSAVDYQKN